MRCTVIALLMLVGAAAHADDLEKARAYFQAGVDAYDSGKYEEALREFQQAHAMSHNPALYFNMAACEEHLNHYQAAALLLRQYVIEKPDADDRQKVEERIKGLESRDESVKQPPPLTTPTPAQLQPQPPPQPVGTAPPAPHKKRIVSWALLGVTGALAAGAIGAGSWSLTQYNSLKSTCGMTMAGCSSSDKDGVHNGAIATDVLIGIGAAAAVATVVMFIVEPKLGHRADRAQLKVTPAGVVF